MPYICTGNPYLDNQQGLFSQKTAPLNRISLPAGALSKYGLPPILGIGGAYIMQKISSTVGYPVPITGIEGNIQFYSPFIEGN